MNTKVNENTIGTKLPAGIINGTEAFYYQGQKMVIHNGHIMNYNEAPTHIKQMILRSFVSDKSAIEIMKQNGIIGVNEGFDMWFHCRIGALDEAPDFVNGNLNADAYASHCTNYDCPMRGKLCSAELGLKNYEIETLKAFQEGLTFDEAADRLCVSVPGLKSRIEKLKEKLDARNMAQLIYRASKMGI